jgi:uncharacterized metal-binding protein
MVHNYFVFNVFVWMPFQATECQILNHPTLNHTSHFLGLLLIILAYAVCACYLSLTHEVAVPEVSSLSPHRQSL